mgnify:CR=1 FL=1
MTSNVSPGGGGMFACPLCSRSIRADHAKEHYEQERMSLLHASDGVRRLTRRTTPSLEGADGVTTAAMEAIRQRRTHRLKYGTAAAPGTPGGPPRRGRPPKNSIARAPSQDAYAEALLEAAGIDVRPTCCICNEVLAGDEADVNAHIDRCLANPAPAAAAASSSSSSSSNSNSVAQERRHRGEETYTWAGVERVRTSTLLEGGYAASGFATTKHDKDVDEDLDVDEDEEQKFGQAQYTEDDLIRAEEELDGEEEVQRMMRAAAAVVAGGSGDAANDGGADQDDGSAGLYQLSPNGAVLVRSLKAKIQQLEAMTSKTVKCLICLEPYNTPVVSVQCWHTHCEKCWLETLGTKRLCPQCNIITSASDLRKVYL